MGTLSIGKAPSGARSMGWSESFVWASAGAALVLLLTSRPSLFWAAKPLRADDRKFRRRAYGDRIYRRRGATLVERCLRGILSRAAKDKGVSGSARRTILFTLVQVRQYHNKLGQLRLSHSLLFGVRPRRTGKHYPASSSLIYNSVLVSGSSIVLNDIRGIGNGSCFYSCIAIEEMCRRCSLRGPLGSPVSLKATAERLPLSCPHTYPI